MQIGDLVKDFTGSYGIIVRIIEDDWGTSGTLYVVSRFGGLEDQLWWDEIEAVADELEVIPCK